MIGSVAMILIIDDDPTFLEIAQIALAAIRSHGILFAETGKRAIELLDKLGDEIAVILVDLNLPDMNGFEVVAILSRKYPKLRVIAISAYGSRDTLDSAKVLGAAAVLAKPISMEQWDDIIERVRGARGASS